MSEKGAEFETGFGDPHCQIEGPVVSLEMDGSATYTVPDVIEAMPALGAGAAGT